MDLLWVSVLAVLLVVALSVIGVGIQRRRRSGSVLRVDRVRTGRRRR